MLPFKCKGLNLSSVLHEKRQTIVLRDTCNGIIIETMSTRQRDRGLFGEWDVVTSFADTFNWLRSRANSGQIPFIIGSLCCQHLQSVFRPQHQEDFELGGRLVCASSFWETVILTCGRKLNFCHIRVRTSFHKWNQFLWGGKEQLSSVSGMSDFLSLSLSLSLSLPTLHSSSMSKRIPSGSTQGLCVSFRVWLCVCGMVCKTSSPQLTLGFISCCRASWLSDPSSATLVKDDLNPMPPSSVCRGQVQTNKSELCNCFCSPSVLCI